ncbi:hypothetical protein LJR258_006838 [Rhizobium sp. LjRoot258]
MRGQLFPRKTGLSSQLPWHDNLQSQFHPGIDGDHDAKAGYLYSLGEEHPFMGTWKTRSTIDIFPLSPEPAVFFLFGDEKFDHEGKHTIHHVCRSSKHVLTFRRVFCPFLHGDDGAAVRDSNYFFAKIREDRAVVIAIGRGDESPPDLGRQPLFADELCGLQCQNDDSRRIQTRRRS